MGEDPGPEDPPEPDRRPRSPRSGAARLAYLLVAAVALAWLGWDQRRELAALAGVAAAAALCSPPAVNRGLAWVARRRGGTPARLAWLPFLGLLGWLVLYWAASAASFSVYLHAFPAAFPVTGPPPVLEVAGAYMVARVLGLLAVFAPQGLGVFEVAVAALLTTATAAPSPALGGLV
ncbi:MAG TPA: hypothetical protein VM386_02665, partial [Acidimicrobiales bacterium]|nr:hypothetical protein [Acidimicrobiales bacterium]